MSTLELKRPDNTIFFKWCLIFFALAVASHETSLDLILAGLFYNKNLGWIYRNSFLVERILHKGGVSVMITFYFALLVYGIYLFKKKLSKEVQFQCLFIFINSIATILVVNLLKHFTTLPCPWHMAYFGSARPNQSIFTAFSKFYPEGHCFPAAHSSAAFPLVSWFFSKKLLGKSKWQQLMPGLILGLLFAGTQEMRGAHFLSHDLTTIFISLFISWALSWCLYFVRP